MEYQAPEVPVTTAQEVVTPEIALALLKTNTFNRHVSMAQVREFCRLIRGGQWALTHQGIAIDCEGRLIDGQHRLLAIAQTLIPVRMLVTRGLPRIAQWQIDKGRVRRVGDEISIYDTMEDQSSDTAKKGRDKQAVASVLADFIHGANSRTLKDSLETLAPFRDGLTFALGCGFSRKLTNGPTRAAVAVAWKTNPDKVKEYFTSFISGSDLSDGSPALAMRNTILTGISGKVERSVNVYKRKLFLCSCRAIEAHLEGTRLRHIHPSVPAFKRFLSLYGLESSIHEP